MYTFAAFVSPDRVSAAHAFFVFVYLCLCMRCKSEQARRKGRGSVGICLDVYAFAGLFWSPL